MLLPVPVMYKIDENTKKAGFVPQNPLFLMHYRMHQVMDTFKRTCVRLLLTNRFLYFIFGRTADFLHFFLKGRSYIFKGHLVSF